MAEEKPLNEQSTEDLKALMDAARAGNTPAPEPTPDPEPTPAPTPEPAAETHTFEYKAADGRVFKGATAEEVFQQIGKARDSAVDALKDRERQIFDLKHQQPPKPIEKPATDTFQQAEYIRLLESDALKAQEYLDQYRPKPEWAQRTEEFVQSNDEMVRARRELEAFAASKAGQQYQQIDNTENANLMRQYMAENDIPKTAIGYRTAFFELKEEGRFNVPAVETKAPPKKTPPPRAATSGGGGNVDTPDPNKMSTEELGKYVREQFAAAGNGRG